MNKELVGRRIKKARISAGLTQKQLADKVGVVQNYIGMIERGISVPSLPTIISLADALNVKLENLLKTYNSSASDEGCLECKNEIIDRLNIFNRRQLQCVLDAINLIEKYIQEDK